jgi:hypothetical protein
MPGSLRADSRKGYEYIYNHFHTNEILHDWLNSDD